MKTFSVVVAIIPLLLTAPGWAQDVDSANDVEQQWQAEEADRDQRQAKLDQLMGTMAIEMQAIQNADNRKDRDALMTEHRHTMREAMDLMHEMGGTRMREMMAEHMSPGAEPETDSDRPQHLHKRMAPARPRGQMSDAHRLSDLESRVDMMQIMMESMMDDHGKN